MWRSYLLFTLAFQLPICPIDPHSLQLYAQFLSRSMSVDSIRNNLSAVKKLHLFRGSDISAFEHISTTDTLRGLQRLHGRPPNKKLPITPELLLRIHSVLDLTDTKHLALWCAFLIAFFTFSRRSNLTSPSFHDFDPSTHLCRADISIRASFLVVRQRCSKTNQFHQRVLELPVAAIPYSPLCPDVQAYSTLVSRVPAPPSAPAFTFRTKRPHFLTHSCLVAGLRSALQRAGFDPKSYSGHSFRRGGASWAFSSDVPAELIKLHGDWKSSAYLEYLEFSFEQKLSVTRTMSSRLCNSSSM